VKKENFCYCHTIKAFVQQNSIDCLIVITASPMRY